MNTLETSAETSARLPHCVSLTPPGHPRTPYRVRECLCLGESETPAGLWQGEEGNEYNRLHRSLDPAEARRLAAEADRLEAGGVVRAQAEVTAADRWRRALLTRVQAFLAGNHAGEADRRETQTEEP